MSYLIDTDIVVGWLKGREKETSLLRSISIDGLAISLITYGEIYEGIYFGRNPETNEQIFRQFLRWVDVLPLNRPALQSHACHT